MAAIVRDAGVEVLRIEMQVQAVDAARGGRPAEPVVADVPCYTGIARATEVAVARGGKGFSPRILNRLFLLRRYPSLSKL